MSTPGRVRKMRGRTCAPSVHAGDGVRRRGLRRADEGRIVTMIPLASLAALIAIGLGVDFSGQTRQEQELRDIAGHCARVGAGSLSVAATPDTVSAVNTAQACLAAYNIQGTVTLTDAGLTVTVNSTYRTKLLTIIGITELPCHGQDSSSITEGR